MGILCNDVETDVYVSELSYRALNISIQRTSFIVISSLTTS